MVRQKGFYLKFFKILSLFNVLLCLGLTACYFLVAKDPEFSPPILTRDTAYLNTCVEALDMDAAECKKFMSKWGGFMTRKDPLAGR